VAYRTRFTCAHCANLLDPAHQIDHLIPRWTNGSDDDENLQPLCAGCHALKTADEAVMRAAAVAGTCFICAGAPAALCPGPTWPSLYYGSRIGPCVPYTPRKDHSAAAAGVPAHAGFARSDELITCLRCRRSWPANTMTNMHNLTAHRASAACKSVSTHASERGAMARWLSGGAGAAPAAVVTSPYFQKT
jgi:hypothetical protein